ncbi:MAG: alpha/beta hydrolase [Burkholderiales bacterium]|nr:alpha/beta hydrolase [Burkholderiales bacterium]
MTAERHAEPASWVLLRGLTRDSRHWDDLPARLQAALPAGTVVRALDAAGNGARWRERSPGTVAAMTEDARASLVGLGLRGPVRLLALSLGAMVAVDWAARHPQELAGAVLVNTSLRPFSAAHERLRWGRWPAVAGALLRRPDAESLERLVLRLTSARPRTAEETDALVARWAGWRDEAPVSAANAMRQLWAAARFRAPTQPPDVPLRVLVGAGDRLVHPRCSERLAAAWGLPLQRHPWAGHDLPLDDPGWVVQAVCEADAAWRRAGQLRPASTAQQATR